MNRYSIKIVFLMFCPLLLVSIDVKILLDELSTKSEITEFSLSSNHGYIISDNPHVALGTFLQDKKIEISHQDDTIVINKKKYLQPIYLMPALSKRHIEQLHHMVDHWFQHEAESIQQLCDPLLMIFDSFVKKDKDPLSDQLLQSITLEIYKKCFLEIIKDRHCEESWISRKQLDGWMNEYVISYFNRLFFEHLKTINLSDKDMKRLHKESVYRHDFFIKQYLLIVKETLKTFYIALPCSLLASIMQSTVDRITYDTNSYVGTFIFVINPKDHHLYMINQVPLDEYLYSVIRSEGWPGWSLETNKFFTIVCRTYATWHIIQAQESKRIYHLKNTNKHQTYRGWHKYTRLKKAIDETKNICIAYDGKPILAMFDSSCGGIIPAHIQGLDFDKHPYLCRTEVCHYCKGYSVSSWKASISHATMIERLAKVVPNITQVNRIQVKKVDPAGLPLCIEIVAQPKNIELSGKKMYSLFPEIKSFFYTIKNISSKKNDIHKKHSKKGKKNSLIEPIFVFDGRGYGHHQGVCQWGANHVISSCGWNYGDAIQFYYPDTTLIKLV